VVLWVLRPVDPPNSDVRKSAEFLGADRFPSRILASCQSPLMLVPSYLRTFLYAVARLGEPETPIGKAVGKFGNGLGIAGASILPIFD